MIFYTALMGFTIANICVTIVMFDLILMGLRKETLFGLPDRNVISRLTAFFLFGVILMMLTLPDLVSSYEKCQVDNGEVLSAPVETTNGKTK